MDLQLEGKRAVITGGSKGIGLAIARALAAEGCDVGLAGRNIGAAEDAARSLAAESGRRVVALTVDTGDDSAVRLMAERAVAELGGVDILVNCAATPNIGGALREENLAHEFNVKAHGYLRTARAFAPGMVEAGWGRIINIAGLATRQSGSVVGSVRNVAVAAITKNLADELGPSGVNVTVVHPAFTRTETTDELLTSMARDRGVDVKEVEAGLAKGISIGRIVRAEEIASVVAFLASPLSIAITGDAIPAGGGARAAIYY